MHILTALLSTLARNSYNLLTKSKSLFKYQSKVGKLLHIQNWRNEMQHLPTSEINEFTELRIRGVKFSYREDQLAALNLQDDQEILFEAGKKYALIGQNKAGKSTLTKIICKLYKPDEGYIALNGIPYSEIPRVVLRNLISYIPQKAFIFPGTIRENILVGNPNATEEELLAAAEAAGVFAFVVNDLSPAMRRTFSTPNFANQLSAASENKSPLKRTGLKPHPESSMLRTVSYKELDSIVSPHPESDFYSNSQFGMYPLVLPDRVRGKHTRSKKDKGPKPSSFLTDSIDWDSDDSDEDSSEDESRDENDSDEDSAESDERTQIMKTSADVMEDYADLTTSGEGEKKEKKKKKKKYKKSGSSLNLRTSYENSANFKSHKGDKLKHPILDQYIGGDVSGGFAQSISLARVFVRTSAKIVILDESMSQMDQIKVRSIVFPKLFQFVNRWNMCLIIITHNMTAMHDLDHIYVLHEGEIAHAGTHQQLLDSKAELYTQLLGQ
jgi:ABC-type multidrug transport system ATPase subunit